MSKIQISATKDNENFELTLPICHYSTYEYKGDSIITVCGYESSKAELNKEIDLNWDNLSTWIKFDNPEDLYNFAIDLLKYNFEKKSAHEKMNFFSKVMRDLNKPTTFQKPF